MRSCRAVGVDRSVDELYERLLPAALTADADAGGLLSINYISGEHATGFTEGRPLLVRKEDSRFTLANLVRALYFASLCALRTGMDILRNEEGVTVDEIRGHGGMFKGGDTAQRMLAAALDVPVSLPSTAGEGGAWGMAVLAAFMLREDTGQTLADYLDDRISGRIGEPILARPARRGRVRCVLRAPRAGPGDRARRRRGAGLISGPAAPSQAAAGRRAWCPVSRGRARSRSTGRHRPAPARDAGPWRGPTRSACSGSAGRPAGRGCGPGSRCR